MSKKAQVINLEQSESEQNPKRQLRLDSGRQIVIHSDEKEELLEIVEPKGDLIMTVRLTDAGPVVTVQGGHLHLKATENLALEAKNIKIKAREEAVIESKGSLKMESSKELGIHSTDDIRVVGKMIHLN